MSRRRLSIITLIAFTTVALLLMMSAQVTAQPTRPTPGGRTGDGRPTVNAPGVQITPPGFNIQSINPLDAVQTPGAMLPTIDPAGLQIPAFDSITLPAGMPSLDDLENMTLPYTVDFSSLTGLQSDQEAYSMIVGFSNEHLGRVVTPLYAGTYVSDQYQVPAQYADLAAQVIGLFPEEVQAVIDAASSARIAAYWGAWSDGAGVVYAGDCTDLPVCPYGMGGLEIEVNYGSIGLYGIYGGYAVPGSEADAMGGILYTFPGLAGAVLTAVPVDSGYAFSGTSVSLQKHSASVVYVGVVDGEGQPFTYALVAVGDTFSQMMPGG